MLYTNKNNGPAKYSDRHRLFIQMLETFCTNKFIVSINTLGASIASHWTVYREQTCWREYRMTDRHKSTIDHWLWAKVHKHKTYLLFFSVFACLPFSLSLALAFDSCFTFDCPMNFARCQTQMGWDYRMGFFGISNLIIQSKIAAIFESFTV